MPAPRTSLVLAVLFALAVPAAACAQSTRSSTSSTRTNSTSSSSSRSGSSSSSMFGSNKSTQGAGSTRSAMGGSSSESLLRSERGAENFVGADANDTRNFLGFTESGQSNRGSGASSRRRTQQGQNTSYNYNNYRGSRSGRTTKTLRPALDLGFQYAGPAEIQLGTRVSTRLAKTPTLQWKGAGQVEVKGGIATLRGTVATEHDRLLAAHLALLEPGVDRVDNQLVVAESQERESPNR